MHVRKTTPEKELQDKERFFRSLSGEERLQMMVVINSRFRNPAVNYDLKNTKVRISRKREHF